MKLKNIKQRHIILNLIELESFNYMQYKDNNNIKYNYKIIEFKKIRFYIIEDFYKEMQLITAGQYKTILNYERKIGTGTNGTK